MRGVVVSGVLFALVVIIMISTGAGLEKVGKDMCSALDVIKSDVTAERWEAAEASTARLKEEWEKSERWVTMFVDHRETDEICKTLYALEEYVKYRETPELMATAGTLRQLFEHIPGKERPVLKNIL